MATTKKATTKKKRGRGRPPHPLQGQLWLRVDPTRLALWKKAAELDGRTISGLVRHVVDQETDRILKEHDNAK